LLSQVLVIGNLLLADVVDEGLPPVHIYHHDLLASLRRGGSVVVGTGSVMDGS
jgi:hypothetical protein